MLTRFGRPLPENVELRMSSKPCASRQAIVKVHRLRRENTEPMKYSLDVIISVGYRVKSKQGVAFRRWASSILKQYLIKGYAVNQKRLDRYDYQSLGISQTTCEEPFRATYENAMEAINALKEKFGGSQWFANEKHHSFSDGNKRIAAMLFLWFMEKNGIL